MENKNKLIEVSLDIVLNIIVTHKCPHETANIKCIAYGAIEHARGCVVEDCERCKRYLDRLSLVSFD